MLYINIKNKCEGRLKWRVITVNKKTEEELKHGSYGGGERGRQPMAPPFPASELWSASSLMMNRP